MGSRISALVMTRSSDSASERSGRLAHAVADDFAAAELDFVPVAAAFGDEVAFDLDEQLRVRQPDTIADRRAEHFSILAAGKFQRHERKGFGLGER